MSLALAKKFFTLKYCGYVFRTFRDRLIESGEIDIHFNQIELKQWRFEKSPKLLAQRLSLL